MSKIQKILDSKDNVRYRNLKKGLNYDVIRAISVVNNDPEWMLELRLKAFEEYKKTLLPTWWPDLSNLNLDEIYYYAKPEEAWNKEDNWDKVPQSLKNTFEQLWIPEAEKTALSWVGAQFDSEVVYHNLKSELREKGVIFEDMSVAIEKYPELIKKYFMKAVPYNDHKFASLHCAVWSWGTFLYIPAWIKIDEPLQAYFRMNIKAWWQFEHTIIVVENWAEVHYIEWCSAPKYWTSSLHAWCVELYVEKNAKLRYSSIENWSQDTYNLNTKRAIIQENWFIEWVGGNLGAWVTMLYPCSVLVGDNSGANHIGVAYANGNQNIDAWAKVIHIGKNTTSKVVSKSISRAWWIATYRWLLDIKKNAINSVASIECDGLILDEKSISDAIPVIKIDNSKSTVSHEATAWKINEEALFYLQSRWVGEQEAKQIIVNWFLSPVTRELPLEYASEMNVLIKV